MTRGIAGSRLVSVGYGSTRPVAENSSADGRSKNRRVEFRLVSGTPAK
jgi:outer membrane protein OmpA-like peptidoglycan-associated protein